jgi:hypothetical protein
LRLGFAFFLRPRFLQLPVAVATAPAVDEVPLQLLLDADLETPLRHPDKYLLRKR